MLPLRAQVTPSCLALTQKGPEVGSAQRRALQSPVGARAPVSPSLGWSGQGQEGQDHPLRPPVPAWAESCGEGQQAQVLPSHLSGVFLLRIVGV